MSTTAGCVGVHLTCGRLVFAAAQAGPEGQGLDLRSWDFRPRKDTLQVLHPTSMIPQILIAFHSGPGFISSIPWLPRWLMSLGLEYRTPLWRCPDLTTSNHRANKDLCAPKPPRHLQTPWLLLPSTETEVQLKRVKTLSNPK